MAKKAPDMQELDIDVDALGRSFLEELDKTNNIPQDIDDIGKAFLAQLDEQEGMSYIDENINALKRSWERREQGQAALELLGETPYTSFGRMAGEIVPQAKFASELLDMIIGTDKQEAAKEFVERQKAQENIPMSPEYEAYSKRVGDAEGVIDMISEAFSEPEYIIPKAAESFAGMPFSTAASVAGSAIGGLPIGAAAGSAMGGREEYQYKVLEEFQKELVDRNIPLTEDNLIKLATDPEFLERTKSKAAKRGATMAVVDSLITYGAGRFFNALNPKTWAGSVARKGTEIGISGPVTEMVPEAAGQVAAGEGIDAKEVLAEGIYGGVPGGAADAITFGVSRFRDKLVDTKPATQVQEEAIQDVEKSDPVIQARKVMPDNVKTQSQFNPEQTYTFKPEEIKTDPERFQFREAVDEVGVTDMYSKTDTWYPSSAGRLLLFEDQDGSLYVADGHHRLALSKRLKKETGQDINLEAKVLSAKDGYTPSTVRYIAARTNILDGKGTPIEIAKVFKERPDIAEKEITDSADRAKMLKGKDLALLSDEIFKKVVSEKKLKPDYARFIGAANATPEQQEALYNFLIKHKPSSIDVAARMVEEAMASGFSVKANDNLSLFGDDNDIMTLAANRANLLSSISSLISGEKSLNKKVATQADSLVEIGSEINIKGHQDRASLLQNFGAFIYATKNTNIRVKNILKRYSEGLTSKNKAQRASKAVGELLDVYKKSLKQVEEGLAKNILQAQTEKEPETDTQGVQARQGSEKGRVPGLEEDVSQDQQDLLSSPEKTQEFLEEISPPAKDATLEDVKEQVNQVSSEELMDETEELEKAQKKFQKKKSYRRGTNFLKRGASWYATASSERVNQIAKYYKSKVAANVSKILARFNNIVRTKISTYDLVAQKVSKIIGADIDTNNKIRAALNGWIDERTLNPEEMEAFNLMRKAFDDLYFEQASAGLNIKYREDYSVLSMDENKVRENPNTFLEDAERAYIQTEIDNMETLPPKNEWVLIKRLKKRVPPQLVKRIEKREFQEQSEELYNYMVNRRVFVPQNPNLSNVPNVNKGRKFSRQAQLDMDKYYDNDLVGLLIGYANRAIKKAEYMRYFDADKWRQKERIMREEGVQQEDIDFIKEVVDITTGMNNFFTKGGAAGTALSFIKTMTAVAYLGRAWMSSIPEYAMGFIKNPSVKQVGKDLKGIAGAIFRTQGNRGRRLLGQALATIPVDVVGPMEAAIKSGFEVEEFRKRGKFSKAILNAFIGTLLTPMTENQRNLNTWASWNILKGMFSDVLEGKATLRTFEMLEELGLSRTESESLGKWFMENQDNFYEARLERNPQAQRVAEIVFEMVNQMNMLPDKATKPLWASHWLGSFMSVFMSYTMTFHNKVYMKNLKEFTKAFSRKNYAMMDRIKFTMPAILMFSVLTPITYLVEEMKDDLFRPEREEKKVSDKVLRAILKANAFGAFSNIAETLYYMTVYRGSLFDATLGAAAGNIKEVVDAIGGVLLSHNSSKNNNAERKLARVMYSNVLKPLVIMGAGASQLGAGATIPLTQVLSDYRIRDKAVDLVAGEKKSGGGQARGRSSSRSGRSSSGRGR